MTAIARSGTLTANATNRRQSTALAGGLIRDIIVYTITAEAVVGDANALSPAVRSHRRLHIYFRHHSGNSLL